MARPTANLRLFVAVYPPPEAAVEMLHRLHGLSIAENRATPPAQLHMTLQFVGDTPTAQLPEVEESVARSAAGIGPLTLTPRRLMTLPRRGPIRLVALETDAPPGLLEIHRRLVARLASKVHGVHAGRFTPHLTLCRFAHQVRASELDLPVALPAFPVARISLMRSILRTEGVEHVDIRRFDLGDQ